ncbi:LysR family transcriptional regulator [Bradyrhizobium sp. LHD-71]|uniref:LysR family transcriptional regulator n=1 Tax=Bradyrhizobium sp. LHD-71 TaxID=3072141 RepID=UPI00280ED625|nr:LysR family transcriptional regulator [Bradyrhizobium sp. LHD-71]MDQ8728307.1 LysR family transcriptional regulator [Bradyrhizobium sp. LHD-71]
MDARALRYFQAVVEFGSYSRASEFLRISQPAVSRQVDRLEQELGKRLLVRNGLGATPTDAGRLLFERSQHILRQLEDAAAEIKSGAGGSAGTIVIAIPPGVGHFLLPPLVESYRKSFPNTSLKIISGYSGYIHEALVRGRADVACLHGPLPQKGFRIVPLLEEEVFLVGQRGTLPTRRAYVTSAELLNLPLILPSRSHASRRILEERAFAINATVNVIMEVDDTSLVRTLLRQGLGFSVLSQGAFENEIDRKELETRSIRPRMSWPLAMMTASGRPRSEPLEALMVTIRERVRDLIASGHWPAKHVDK